MDFFKLIPEVSFMKPGGAVGPDQDRIILADILRDDITELKSDMATATASTMKLLYQELYSRVQSGNATEFQKIYDGIVLIGNSKADLGPKEGTQEFVLMRAMQFSDNPLEALTETDKTTLERMAKGEPEVIIELGETAESSTAATDIPPKPATDLPPPPEETVDHKKAIQDLITGGKSAELNTYISTHKTEPDVTALFDAEMMKFAYGTLLEQANGSQKFLDVYTCLTLIHNELPRETGQEPDLGYTPEQTAIANALWGRFQESIDQTSDTPKLKEGQTFAILDTELETLKSMSAAEATPAAAMAAALPPETAEVPGEPVVETPEPPSSFFDQIKVLAADVNLSEFMTKARRGNLSRATDEAFFKDFVELYNASTDKQPMLAQLAVLLMNDTEKAASLTQETFDAIRAITDTVTTTVTAEIPAPDAEPIATPEPTATTESIEIDFSPSKFEPEMLGALLGKITSGASFEDLRIPIKEAVMFKRFDKDFFDKFMEHFNSQGKITTDSETYKIAVAVSSGHTFTAAGDPKDIELSQTISSINATTNKIRMDELFANFVDLAKTPQTEISEEFADEVFKASGITAGDYADLAKAKFLELHTAFEATEDPVEKFHFATILAKMASSSDIEHIPGIEGTKLDQILGDITEESLATLKAAAEASLAAAKSPTPGAIPPAEMTDEVVGPPGGLTGEGESVTPKPRPIGGEFDPVVVPGEGEESITPGDTTPKTPSSASPKPGSTTIPETSAATTAKAEEVPILTPEELGKAENVYQAAWMVSRQILRDAGLTAGQIHGIIGTDSSQFSPARFGPRGEARSIERGVFELAKGAMQDMGIAKTRIWTGVPKFNPEGLKAVTQSSIFAATDKQVETLVGQSALCNPANYKWTKDFESQPKDIRQKALKQGWDSYHENKGTDEWLKQLNDALEFVDRSKGRRLFRGLGHVAASPFNAMANNPYKTGGTGLLAASLLVPGFFPAGLLLGGIFMAAAKATDTFLKTTVGKAFMTTLSITLAYPTIFATAVVAAVFSMFMLKNPITVFKETVGLAPSPKEIKDHFFNPDKQPEINRPDRTADRASVLGKSSEAPKGEEPAKTAEPEISASLAAEAAKTADAMKPAELSEAAKAAITGIEQTPETERGVQQKVQLMLLKQGKDPATAATEAVKVSSKIDAISAKGEAASKTEQAELKLLESGSHTVETAAKQAAVTTKAQATPAR